MSATGNKAVFLSYASQDAGAVRGIAEALRAGGVEVWFDQNELRGGDAWDQKIRRQIRDCTLFMPVISAATQARGEGYFRREWKLAVERTMDMADGVPYLFPLVLDGVPDRDALVPEVFRQVQWTRLGAAGLPPAFVANVRGLLGDTVGVAPAESAGSSPRSVTRVQARGASRRPRLIAGSIILIVAVAGWLALRDHSATPVTTPVSPAASTPASAKPTVAPASKETLDPRRVALARFENLSGDASLDNIARIVESELTRGLGTLSTIRLLPVDAAGRVAARNAARAAGAGSFIIGSYLKQGDRIEISAEIVLTAEGEVFGTVGPAAMAAAELRGPALAEFTDRLATGANNVSATLQNPPTRIAAVVYNRPWPRWSVATRAIRLRQMEANTSVEIAKAVQGYRDLLAEAPEMLKVKHDLARLFLFTGRFDESQQLFRELLGPDRSKLSESEILAITYDEALLAGDPDRAIAAARGLLELRPVSDAITQVISCLWAQNRPRAALTELQEWAKRYNAQLPETSRPGLEAALLATEGLMHLQRGEPAKTLETLQRGNGRPSAYSQLLRFEALAALGREADQLNLVTEAGLQSPANRIDPIMLQWQGYSLALHHGRPDEAKRWMAAALKSWDDLPGAQRESDHYMTLSLWLFLEAGRLPEALKVAENLTTRYPDLANTIGSRAIVFTALGRADEAAPLIRRLEQWDMRNARGLPAYWRARLAVRAGDKARAVELLRQAVAGGLWFGGFDSPTFSYGRSEPEFAVLRGYAPYEQLLKPKG